ncbi:MAG TPA: DUF1566 domain-containing protein [Acidobacteriaceae bacterium]|nr:DUF1566 domain-containing protein [Acidobacteriaceae bacterium]
MRWTLAIMVFVIVCIVCGCKVGSSAGGAVASQTDNGAIPDNTISGTVTLNGSPLAGATVTLFNTNYNVVAGTATTDASGNYRFTALPATGNVPTEYQLWAQKTGYGFYPSAGSGAKVMRWDYTGQFQGNGLTDAGIYFTVIDYFSLPHAPLTGADFIASDGSTPRVHLAATGQTASFASGDDGDLHQGTAWGASRFTDNGDGSVTDTLTGLVWLKDAGCLPAANWATAITEATALKSGACGLTDGSKAGDWRLPNLNELESLVDVSAAHPAVTVGHPFLHVSNGIYWSSTSYFGGVGGSPLAWAIRMDDGRYINDVDGKLNNKSTASNAVWAVRGSGTGGAVKLAATGYYDEPGQVVQGDDGNLQTGVGLSYARFIDNGDGTLTDTMTGLVWMKKADCINGTWEDAVAAVRALGNGACSLTDHSQPGDWRVPNRNEMQSLQDRMVNNVADFMNATYVWKSDAAFYRGPLFTSFHGYEYYWTSTTDAADTTAAWTVFSCDFGVYDIPKSSAGFALAVRDKR